MTRERKIIVFLQRQVHKKILQYLLLIFFLPIQIFSETHSNYRFEDSLFSKFGRRDLSFENRAISESNVKNLSFTNENYLQNRFYSQRGGNPSDIAGKYANQLYASPEFTGIYKNSSKEISVIFSPNVFFRETVNLEKQSSAKMDSEFLIFAQLSKSENKFSVQAGRGFQRFDSYGIFFSNFANFIELKFQNEKLGFVVSPIFFEFNYQNKSMLENKIGTQQKAYGFSTLFQKIPALKTVNFFYFHLLEPIQVSEKNFLREDVNFFPRGNFDYATLELKTRNFFSYLNIESGLFHVQGKRNLKEFFYQRDNFISTRGNLIYLLANFEFDLVQFRFGGLYKPVKNKNRNEENGYSGLLNDSRIFGGKSSFLLQESIQKPESETFRELNSTESLRFNSNGLKLLNFSTNFNFKYGISATLIFNRGILYNIYSGYESILQVGHSQDQFYFLGSITRADVKLLKTERSYNEIQLESRSAEFWRFYFSAGLRF